MINYPSWKSSSPTSRAHSPTAIAHRLYTQLELESQAFLLQCRSPIGPETIRLYRELNSLKARRYRRHEELRRLKDRLEYSDLTREKPEEAHLLQSQHTALMTSLQSVKHKLLLEERTTESLREMLEKVTKAQLLMRQRTTELISIRSTMDRHLASATTMRDRATACLTETNSQQSHLAREMAASRGKFQVDLGRKAATATRIARERQGILDRICTGVCEKVAKKDREIEFLQQLQTEVQRKHTATRDLEQAETDKAAFSHKFGRIEDILARESCEVDCRNGLSRAAVSVIIEQFNIFQVIQGSLASRYSQLAQELTDKEKQLSSLQGLCGSLKEQSLPSKRSIEERRVKPVIETEQLGLNLYAGVITLLGRFVVAREKMGQIGGSDVWIRVKNAVKGLKRREKEPSGGFIRPSKRHSTVFYSPPDSPEHLNSPLSSPQPSDFSLYIPLSVSEIDHIVQNTIVAVREKAVIRYLFEYDRVVKYFVDTEMLISALRSGRYISDIIGKAHFALKTSFKELINLAQLSLEDFSHIDSLEKAGKCTYPQEIPERKASPQRKDTRRSTDKTLFRLHSMMQSDRGSSPPSPIKKSTLRQLSISSDKSQSMDQEAVEGLHIREERAKARNSPLSQGANKRFEGCRSASRLATDDNPYSQRKRGFIREFLLIQRKLSEVKVSERQSKSRSPPASPQPSPFQLLPWLSQSRSARGRHCRSP